MESLQKKRISSFIVAVFCICMALEASLANDVFSKGTGAALPAQEGIQSAESLTFWYTGEENRGFFEACAADFLAETGIAVLTKHKPEKDYFSGIYDASAAGEEFPDAYLLDADELEKAYFGQVAKENENRKSYESICLKNAVTASVCQDKMAGYPLYFQTYLFAFQNGYFETPPTSIAEMLSYSVEHDPGDGVEKLFEWNLGDAFYNFAFFGAAEDFQEKEMGLLEAGRNEEVFQACEDLFALLSDNIELKAEELTPESIRKDFAEGRTIAVLLDTDDLKMIQDADMTVTVLPALKETIPMTAAAKTAVICVNELSQKTAAAEKFAEYVTIEKSSQLQEMTGHLPVVISNLLGEREKLAGSQYENARLLPNMLNAVDYWVKFQNTVLEIWNGTEL